MKQRIVTALKDSKQRRAERLPTKVFVVGHNKTGTTSTNFALQSLGYDVAKSADTEPMMEDWARRDFKRLIALCHRYDAFQDVPFSLGYTHHVLDHEFPGSKFILTVRGSSDQWYSTLLRFWTSIAGTEEKPTIADLQAADYRLPGFLWRYHELFFEVENDDQLLDRERYIAAYERHNSEVRAYFAHRPDDFMELDVAEPDAMESLCRFLDIEFTGQEMPHLNSYQGEQRRGTRPPRSRLHRLNGRVRSWRERSD